MFYKYQPILTMMILKYILNNLLSSLIKKNVSKILCTFTLGRIFDFGPREPKQNYKLQIFHQNLKLKLCSKHNTLLFYKLNNKNNLYLVLIRKSWHLQVLAVAWVDLVLVAVYLVTAA